MPSSRLLLVCGLAAGIALLVGIGLSFPFHDLFSSDIPADRKLEIVRYWIQSWGAFAPVAYVAMVTVEVVVAPLPGAILYAPGGLCFGGFWGGLYSLVGNTFGAVIACTLMKRFGEQYFAKWLGKDWQVQREKLAGRGFWVVFALRVNPLTSSDLVSYAAGLTAIPIWHVAAATALGMSPLCFAQSYLSEELFTAFPALMYPLLLLCLGYTAVIVWLLSKNRLSTSTMQ